MNIRMLFPILCLALLAPPVLADDGMDIGTSVKVNRAKRHQMMEDRANAKSGEEAAADQDEDGDPCNGVEIGTVHVDRGKAPRDVTVIVTGDVINVPSRRCK